VIAWLAPGQGAERAGMSRAVAGSPLVASLEPGLHDTGLVQPALVATALAIAEVLLGEGVPCDVVAGHSVGELAAWALAGGAAFPEAVALARVRGRAMASAGAGQLWAVGDAEPVPDGWTLAVENPGQRVICGVGAPPVGARPLPTTGPWHSPAMASAVGPFQAALAALPSRPLVRPLVSGQDGRDTRDDAVARRNLAAQLTSPLRWTAVLARLGALGVTDVVTLGPGKLLAAHVAAALPEVRVHRTDRAPDLEAAVQGLRTQRIAQT
jgi:[acyl-carrier-protein] S-malonyltransferase